MDTLKTILVLVGLMHMFTTTSNVSAQSTPPSPLLPPPQVVWFDNGESHSVELSRVGKITRARSRATPTK